VLARRASERDGGAADSSGASPCVDLGDDPLVMDVEYNVERHFLRRHFRRRGRLVHACALRSRKHRHVPEPASTDGGLAVRIQWTSHLDQPDRQQGSFNGRRIRYREPYASENLGCLAVDPSESI
jgi:hypothetical protein